MYQPLSFPGFAKLTFLQPRVNILLWQTEAEKITTPLAHCILPLTDQPCFFSPRQWARTAGWCGSNPEMWSPWCCCSIRCDGIHRCASKMAGLLGWNIHFTNTNPWNFNLIIYDHMLYLWKHHTYSRSYHSALQKNKLEQTEYPHLSLEPLAPAQYWI